MSFGSGSVAVTSVTPPQLPALISGPGISLQAPSCPKRGQIFQACLCPGGKVERLGSRKKAASLREKETQACENHFRYFTHDLLFPTPSQAIQLEKENVTYTGAQERLVWVDSSPRSWGCCQGQRGPVEILRELCYCSDYLCSLIHTNVLNPVLSQGPPPRFG